MRQLALSLALALAPAAAFAAVMDVPLDQSAFVTLSAPAHNVIVGNPTIADASVVDQRHIIITGKGAGVTNLLITDAGGRPIFDREIVVGGGGGGRVTVISGGQVTNYNCSPTCESGDGAAGGFLGALTTALTAGIASGMAGHHATSAVEASPNVP